MESQTENGKNIGSVAICCIIVGDILYVVNLGDSRAVLIDQNGVAKSLSNEHTPNRPDERERIEKLGGVVLVVHDQERIMGEFLEAVKFGHKVVFTYRNYFFHFRNPFNVYEVKLNGLTDGEASLLVNALLGESIEAKYSKDVKKLLDIVHNSPLGIVAAINLLKVGKLSMKEIVSKLYSQLNYYNFIFEEEQSSKIILPEIPEIITEVKLINTSLTEKVKADPNYIYSMTSRQFEEFVAELFERDGYNVSLTKQTRDGGKDLFIVENRRFGRFLYYLECKRFSPEIPVGVRFVRELYGTVIADRATAGLIVTSSYFSKEAIKFTEQVKNQMSLMEFIDLKKWISST